MQQQVLIRTREMQELEATHGKPIEDILRDLYVVGGLTVEQVGAELGVTQGTVSRWLDRVGIAARRPGPRGEVVA
jgi:DNA-binding MarR family transcriptional regulator